MFQQLFAVAFIRPGRRFQHKSEEGGEVKRYKQAFTFLADILR